MQRLGKHSPGNEYTGSNKQLPFLCNSKRKHISVTMEELLGYSVLNVFSVRGP
jgi:hypothetical protein